MTNPRVGLALLRGSSHSSRTQRQSLEQGFQCLRVSNRTAPTSRTTTRSQSTTREQSIITSDYNPGPIRASIVHARPLPISPSYFSLSTQFNDEFIRIQDLYRRMLHLPQAPPDKLERAVWIKLPDYRAMRGTRVLAAHFAQCLSMAKHLHRIHPDLKTKQLREALLPFMRDVRMHDNAVREIPIDRFGRALGVGRRKTSVARAWVVEGDGEVKINGKSLSEAFGRVHDRESAIWALRAVDRLDKYNVWALVEGGGTTGQAEALTLAVAKALMAHEPALKPALRRAGCVTRDPRMVERKKAGHVKARKMPTWVKR